VSREILGKASGVTRGEIVKVGHHRKNEKGLTQWGEELRDVSAKGVQGNTEFGRR